MEVAVAVLSRLFAGWMQPPGNTTLQANCLALKTNFTFENTAILDATYLPRPSKLSTLGSCQTSGVRNTAPICRVQFHTNTSATSGIDAEVWLPDEWNGRFMGLGNRGLTGCIRYGELDFGSALHFATVSSNGGHDGDTAFPLLNNPESLLDFSSRAVHTEAVVGKQLIEAYYDQPPRHSYYVGCSQGGRQGTKAALKHPEDFDGILVGAPAVDFTHFIQWTGMQHHHIGASRESDAFIPPASWKQIAKEVLRQCDGLDGVMDGIITEPDSCDFRPESLLCHWGQAKGTFCLTPPQVDALRKIYSPLYGSAGKLIYPRLDPGSESSPSIALPFGGDLAPYASDWLKYVIFNGSEYQPKDYSLAQTKRIHAAGGEGMVTFSGDFSAFRDRGGKFIAYHGRADPLVPSGISKRLYDLISRTNSLPSLDEFYRLFLIPGMDHCEGGPGAFKFGQSPNARAPTANSTHDIISALVDWVENGIGPESIIGTDMNAAEREHCRYPMKSVWDSEMGRFNCRT
ncbi:tannase and feruloyl esterase [Mycena amicta]|nr:tannase and feruloyl esterase [Mycena amicta]